MRDGSATNPAGDLASKKLYWLGVKPEKEPEGKPYPDIFRRGCLFCRHPWGKEVSSQSELYTECTIDIAGG